MADITKQILEAITSYTAEVEEKVTQVSRKTAAECAQQLNDASQQFQQARKSRKAYAGSWRSKKDGLGYVVHSTVPGMPHLLENGHVIANKYGTYNGKVPAYKHILPVAEEMGEEFENRVREVLG